MGLGDLTPDDAKSQRYRQYGSHEWDDKLEQWAEEAQSLFPGGVEYDFIEVSPEMSAHDGFAYCKPDSSYIRISEKAIDRWPEHYIQAILIHEMAHLWFDQNGYSDYSDGSGIFEWVLGRVGADINKVSPQHEEYEIMLEFLNHEP